MAANHSFASLSLSPPSHSPYALTHCSNPISRKQVSFFFNSRSRNARRGPRPVSLRSQMPDSDSVKADPNGAGFGSGSGSPASLSQDCSAAGASSSPSNAIDFLTLCHSLKTTKRKGWINHGIRGPESIADHMYRMALMALIAGDLPGVNRERCIKIAIVHDIAEAIVGDITPSDGVPKEEKSRREKAALNEMCEILGGGMRAEEIQELWAEYENNASLEANLVKDFDKVELILQALEYEAECLHRIRESTRRILPLDCRKNPN
ncbi:PREDICTED: HD domain-containing protein 2 isoform X2 [Ipomoea nil]|uniref:HD domain-containing protein 2 isoform X2 n=1 Tax=Ipomoea nil TaxID=35883 RepID=UPI0009016BA5|nr:PREDICTED: HD domain-containing protein 2 isoform X2 [Ipomoea nil]